MIVLTGERAAPLELVLANNIFYPDKLDGNSSVADMQAHLTE